MQPIRRDEPSLPGGDMLQILAAGLGTALLLARDEIRSCKVWVSNASRVDCETYYGITQGDRAVPYSTQLRLAGSRRRVYLSSREITLSIALLRNGYSCDTGWWRRRGLCSHGSVICADGPSPSRWPGVSCGIVAECSQARVWLAVA